MGRATEFGMSGERLPGRATEFGMRAASDRWAGAEGVCRAGLFVISRRMELAWSIRAECSSLISRAGGGQEPQVVVEPPSPETVIFSAISICDLYGLVCSPLSVGLFRLGGQPAQSLALLGLACVRVFLWGVVVPRMRRAESMLQSPGGRESDALGRLSLPQHILSSPIYPLLICDLLSLISSASGGLSWR